MKCWRSFFQALIHGLFINLNLLQLLGLTIMDIFIIYFLIVFRGKFLYKLNFILITLFFIAFAAFDITLLLYVIFNSEFNTLSEASMAIYDFALLIVIAALVLITLMRMVFNVGVMLFEAMKSFCKSKKIKNKQ